MMSFAESRDRLDRLDDATKALVVLSAIVTAGSDRETREALAQRTTAIPPQWIEEVLLQSYLFAGFPRALNAMREWRRLVPQSVSDSTLGDIEQWRADGEVTCAAVYGTMYDRLRSNIRTLHPLLDEWMITEGYGKVLSRPGLDLARRELCIVAACAAAGQDRQLHSHLHGALNVGVDPVVIDHVVEVLGEHLDVERATSARMLWARVRGK